MCLPSLKNSRKQISGFTLIELMVVIAILGVLASVAMPSMFNYVKKTKASEAIIGIRNLYTGALSYYNDVHTPALGASTGVPQFPRPGDSTAPGICDTELVPGDRRQHVEFVALTDADCFDALSFTFDDPVYFRYTFDTETSLGGEIPADFMGTRHFTAIANGDLDADGLWSTFARSGAVSTSTSNVGAVGGMFVADRIE